MSQMHIGNRGVPMKCVAQPGKCPKAPGIGHFQKVEQAQEFADRLNELEASGFTYKDVPKEDISKLDNAQLILAQKELNAHKSEYEDYKQRIKWRKEVRSKAQREMKSIIDDNNNQIARVVQANNLTAQARRAWKNAEGEERKTAYAQDKEALANSNAVYAEASEITKANQENFAKLVDKKEKAETELQEFMEARAIQSSEKNYAINVDAEVDKREMAITDSKPMKLKNITFQDEQINLLPNRYEDTNAIAISIQEVDDDYAEPVTISAVPDEEELIENEIEPGTELVAISYEDSDIANMLAENGLIEEEPKIVNFGDVYYYSPTQNLLDHIKSLKSKK